MEYVFGVDQLVKNPCRAAYTSMRGRGRPAGHGFVKELSSGGRGQVSWREAVLLSSGPRARCTPLARAGSCIRQSIACPFLTFGVVADAAPFLSTCRSRAVPRVPAPPRVGRDRDSFWRSRLPLDPRPRSGMVAGSLPAALPAGRGSSLDATNHSAPARLLLPMQAGGPLFAFCDMAKA